MATQILRRCSFGPICVKQIRALYIGQQVYYKNIPQRQSKTQNAKQKTRSRSILSSVSAKLRETIFLGDRYRESIYRKTGPLEKMDNKQIKSALNKTTLAQLSDQEINSILETIAAVSKSPVVMAMSGMVFSETSKLTALRNIEQECIRRIPENDVQTHLLWTDTFYCCQFEAGQFMKYLLEYYANNWKDLSMTPTNVVQLLFYATNSRNCLVEHMIMFEEFLADNAESLTGKEVSLVCFSYFVNNTQIMNSRLLSKMADIVLRDLESGMLDIELMINVMKAFRQAGFDSLSFYQKLGDLCCEEERLNHNVLRPTVIISILHTFSSLRIAHSKLFEVYLQEFLKIKHERSKKIRAKDLTRLLGSCATLGVEVPDWLVADLIRELSNADQQREFPSLSLEALHSLAVLDVYPHHLYNLVLSESMTNRMTSRSDIHWNRLVLLDTSIGIAGSSYTGSRLTQDFLQSVPKSALGNLDRQLTYRVGMGPLYLALRDLHGEQGVKCHFLLKFSRMPDIELRLDGEGKPICMEEPKQDDPSITKLLTELKHETNDAATGTRQEPSVLESMLLEDRKIPNRESQIPAVTHVMPEKACTLRKIAIRVMGRNQYIRNSPRLTGAHSMEIKLLSKLGYQVIVISPSKAQEIQDMASEELLEFAQHLLHEST